MRWCFRVVEKDRGSYNHIQLLDFDRDSMKGFEALLREKSNETSHEISSGSDVSPQSNSPMTLKTLCRSISSVLEHIDAARLDPLLSAQRKVSNRDRKSSGLASNVQTAIFLFGASHYRFGVLWRRTAEGLQKVCLESNSSIGISWT